jgi:Spy/CpxP family protein refolding chaperone
MKRSVFVLALVSSVVFSISYGYALGPGEGAGRGPRDGGYQERVPGRAYALNPDQMSKMDELQRRFRAENAQLIGAMVGKRLELRVLWTDPNADPNAILQKEKELRDLQDQMKDKMVRMRLEARKFLTPDQIAHWGQRQEMRRGQGRGMWRDQGMDWYGPGMGGDYGMGRGYEMGPGHGRGRGWMGPGYGMEGRGIGPGICY